MTLVPLTPKQRATVTPASPTPGPPRNVVVDRLVRRLDRLDAEQLQIIEIVIAAMCRGAM